MDNFVVAKTFVIPKTKNYKWYNWLGLHREKIGLKNTICLYCGRLLSELSWWKYANKELRDYIEQK